MDQWQGLEKAKSREARRLDERILDPVEVHTIDDIKRVLAELDPSQHQNRESAPITLTTHMQGSDERGNSHLFQVKADTKSRSKREILLEGFGMLRRRLEAETQSESSEPVEVNGRQMRPALVAGGASGMTWVDRLIDQWFGAKRDELFICWDIGDGYTYRYNIFEHRLTRIQNAED